MDTFACKIVSGMSLLMLLFLLAPAGQAMKLPSYLKPCSRSDPKINECALKNGREAVPYLLSGDPKYKLPNLRPLRIEEIRVEQDGSVGLNLVLKDVDINGIENAEVRNIDIDFNEKRMSINLFLPLVQLMGTYNMSGRILILPIFGNGPANITLENVPLNYTLQYNMAQRKGKEYLDIVDSTASFDTTQAHFLFDNLFNGDERLRENVRQVVNDNWRQVVNDVGPTIVKAIANVVTQIISNVAKSVPFDEIFLP